MTEQDQALFSALSPEELQQLLGMGSLDERGDAIQQQLEQAMALRNVRPVQRSTAGGAILSGLGDVVGNVRSEMQQKDLRSQQAANLDKKDAGRLAYAQAMANALRRSSEAQNLAEVSHFPGATPSTPPLLAADVPTPPKDGFTVTTRARRPPSKLAEPAEDELGIQAQRYMAQFGG